MNNENKILEHMISQEYIPVGLNGVDNNLWWERLKDMIKLYDYYKCWGNSWVLLGNIFNTVMLWSDRNGKTLWASEIIIMIMLLKEWD